MKKLLILLITVSVVLNYCSKKSDEPENAKDQTNVDYFTADNYLNTAIMIYNSDTNKYLTFQPLTKNIVMTSCDSKIAASEQEWFIKKNIREIGEIGVFEKNTQYKISGRDTNSNIIIDPIIDPRIRSHRWALGSSTPDLLSIENYRHTSSLFQIIFANIETKSCLTASPTENGRAYFSVCDNSNKLQLWEFYK